MTEAIPLPIEDDEHLVEPPIIDFLRHDPARRVYVVTFVPEDDVSPAETEMVEIPEKSEDGRRMFWQLEKLAQLWRPVRQIERIAHSGGGNFEFHFAGGKTGSLSDNSPNPDFTFQVYACLQDMSRTAEFAFIDKQRTQPVLVKEKPAKKYGQ